MMIFSFFNIGTVIRKFQKRNQLLDLYYPKKVYDPLARREMKVLLTQFNDVFYEAYPGVLKGQAQLTLDDQPHTHSKRFEVQQELTAYQMKKVRKKTLVKIEKYLNMKYVLEERIAYYELTLQKAERTKKQISNEEFISYFPQLFEERLQFLDNITENCVNRIKEANERKRTYEERVYEMVHYPDSFFRDASRIVGNMVAESVKHVVEVVDQSFRRKS